MSTRTLRRWATGCLVAIWAAGWIVTAAAAQDVDEPNATATDTGDATAAAPVEATVPQFTDVDTGATGIDYMLWDRLATRAEQSVTQEGSSNFALERLRNELVTWRDRFLSAQSLNGGRIATVRAQLDALGAAPEDGGSEDPAIAGRRSTLEGQLARLRAPVVLADEAYARADGLIREIDRILRARETSRLTTRGPSPLNPEHWPSGVSALGSGFGGVWSEISAAFVNRARNGTLTENAPQAALWLFVAVALWARGRRLWDSLRTQVVRREGRGARAWNALFSLGVVVVPYLGLVAFAEALTALDILGFRGNALLDLLPEAGLYVLVGRWLSGRFFDRGAHGENLLKLDADVLERGRRIVASLGWVLAFGALFIPLVRMGDASSVSAAVMTLPVEIVMAVFLFRLGRLLSKNTDDDEAPEGAAQQDAEDWAPPQSSYRSRFMGLLGRASMLVAVIAPVLSAAGYSAASEAILYPSVTTLALLAVLVLLQRFVSDVTEAVSGPREDGQDALLPVLVGLFLFLLALPVLAVVWGARVEDLLEIWTRFREGFELGETRISPSDFVTFAMVFVIGYMATRLVQGTLRASVLPKTKLDIGGQNAIVSGLGYVGISLAAVAAITAAGIDLSSLAIVAGALSVGIGFGLQNVVSNFISGIILLIERPISEGDWIEVSGQMGYVRDISVRSTRIETFDRTDVIIPNADLISGQVINWTRGNSVGRVIVPVGVAYGTDTDRVAKILQEIAEAHPMVVMSTPPSVVFQGFGADSLDFEIRAILRDVNWVLNVKSDLNHAIAKRFAEEGIEIPFAQRDIWLRNPEVLQGTKWAQDEKSGGDEA